MNERYSPLDQIDTSNVSQLKGVWRTHLDGSGVGAKYSAESQPVVYKGVMYVTTGEDDASRSASRRGKILWTYKSGISQKITTVCCGWLNRGVAIGDGRVYFGQLDGKVVALDQKTGKRALDEAARQVAAGPDDHRRTDLRRRQDLHRRRRRGVRHALVPRGDGRRDRKAGVALVHDAGPGDPGGNTWPSGSKEYLRGGATIWQAPAVDPKLGLLYFSTGNAGSDWFGGDRPGKNLYAASMVALDLKTGKLKWYFQQVHHDIWDFDSASPVILFDAGGKQGIAQASKTGWLYMLDRATGKPLYGIPEKPVPQNAAQKSWPTQPIPDTASSRRTAPVPAADVARVKKQAVGPLKKVPVVVAKVPFTPAPPGKLLIYGNGPQGGVNWQPVSYNEKTHMIYVCSSVSWVGFEAANMPFVATSKSYTGVAGAAGVAWPEASGTFTAIDATSGKTSGRRHSRSRATAGTATTAGNLVFVGRNGGQLQAYDATNGDRWSFQTGAGANNTSTIFQQDGKEYVAFLSGGNSLGGDATRRQPLALRPRRDARPGADARQGHRHAARRRGQRRRARHAPRAMRQRERRCSPTTASSCHGADGHGGNGGPDLTGIPSAKNYNTVAQQVENGGSGMPAFKGQLTPKQIADVSTYVTQKITKNNK